MTWADFYCTCENWQHAMAHLMSALMRMWTVIFLVSYIDRLKWQHFHCWANADLSAPSDRNICPLPLRYATVLCFAAVHEWGNSRGKANKQSTDSKHRATGGNYPTHNRPIVSILGSQEIPFPGTRKKDQDSRVSSPVNIPIYHPLIFSF